MGGDWELRQEPSEELHIPYYLLLLLDSVINK
jgi:hypothetical protein